VSSALATNTDYINDARVLLLDYISPFRYSDASLIEALNLTLLEGRRIRPDLFIYWKLASGKAGVQWFSANDGTTVFIEEQFRLGFLNGMVGYALQRDQEDLQDQRSGAFLKIFSDILLGVRPATLGNAQGAP
jgi:hypothetical protein